MTCRERAAEVLRRAAIWALGKLLDLFDVGTPPADDDHPKAER